LRLECLNPSILKTERPPVTCARSKSYCGRRNRPTAPPAPPAKAGSFCGGRPEVVCARTKRRFDPDLTSNGCRTTSDRVGIPPRNGGNALGGFLRLVAEYVSYFALRTTDRRNYTVPVPPIAGARRQCLIDDRSPSVEIPGSANQVDLVEAARQKSEAATEARTSAWSIRARSKLGRCGCARFPANRLQARIW